MNGKLCNGGFITSASEMDCYKFNNEVYTFYQLKYNTSWEWLMPVVEKIENITLGNSYLYSFEMGKDWCTITTNDFTPEIIVSKSVANDKKTSIWSCVVEFIKLYNIKK